MDAEWSGLVAHIATASIARDATAGGGRVAVPAHAALSRKQKKHTKRRDRRDAAKEKSLRAVHWRSLRCAELAASKWAAKIAELAALSAYASQAEADRVAWTLSFWASWKLQNTADCHVPDLELRRLAAHLANRAHALREAASHGDGDEGNGSYGGWTHPSDADGHDCYS